MDFTETFLRLILAHLLGDFYVQPARWVDDRRQKHARSAWLYVHGVVHGLIAWIALGNLERWTYAATIAAAHIVIDLLKSHVDSRGRSAAWFLIDQALHVAVLTAIARALAADGISAPASPVPPAVGLLAIAAALLILARPVGFFIRTFTRRWESELLDRTDNLPGAGMWIGVIERLLVLTFVMIDALEAVGFLLAAKSVFRFGDLRDANDRKRTEYVLVGTLISFAVAMFVALAARWLTYGSVR